MPSTSPMTPAGRPALPLPRRFGRARGALVGAVALLRADGVAQAEPSTMARSGDPGNSRSTARPAQVRLRGPRGYRGYRGYRGFRGAVGATGATGATGGQGAAGVEGARGATGAQGVTGA